MSLIGSQPASPDAYQIGAAFPERVNSHFTLSLATAPRAGCSPAEWRNRNGGGEKWAEDTVTRDLEDSCPSPSGAAWLGGPARCPAQPQGVPLLPPPYPATPDSRSTFHRRAADSNSHSEPISRADTKANKLHCPWRGGDTAFSDQAIGRNSHSGPIENGRFLLQPRTALLQGVLTRTA